ncbi:hypothetical protein HDU67_005258 [Dinochytrium kinnereticum]|nr:hypothetical protein HDU67_005258 [Dinochytrium kinnereticum]
MLERILALTCTTIYAFILFTTSAFLILLPSIRLLLSSPSPSGLLHTIFRPIPQPVLLLLHYARSISFLNPTPPEASTPLKPVSSDGKGAKKKKSKKDSNPADAMMKKKVMLQEAKGLGLAAREATRFDLPPRGILYLAVKLTCTFHPPKAADFNLFPTSESITTSEAVTSNLPSALPPSTSHAFLQTTRGIAIYTVLIYPQLCSDLMPLNWLSTAQFVGGLIGGALGSCAIYAMVAVQVYEYGCYRELRKIWQAREVQQMEVDVGDVKEQVKLAMRKHK